MLKSILSAFTLTLVFFANAQNITLIQDANPGANGSVRGMSAELNDNIYYIGFKAGQFSNQLFEYDSESGSVASVTPAFNTTPNLLAASTNNIYTSDGNILYRFDTDNNNLIQIFENDSPSDEFEIIETKGETIVALSESFDGNWNVFLINEATSVEVKVNSTPIDEEIAATIGNNYVAIRAFGSFADEEKGNLLFERSTGTVVEPSEVIEDSPCTDIINMLTIGDYILYDCNDGNRYIYSVSQKSSTELSGFAKDVRENDDYVFIHSGIRLYSYNKTTNDVVSLEVGIQHIGEVNEVDGELYFLVEFSDRLYSTDGTEDNTRSYDIEGEVGSSSEIIGVLDFDDTPVLAFNEGVRDFWIVKVEDEETESITGLIEIFGDYLPFFKINNNLIFSYDHPEFGEELFKADFESTNTTEEKKIESEVSIFPNPANDILTIATDKNVNTAIAVDMFGKSYNLKIESNKNLNIRSLAPGLYSLVLNANDINKKEIVKFQKF